MDDLSKHIKVTPAGVVMLNTAKPTEVTVENLGDRFLAYKLKTTRPLNAKPNHANGVIKPGSKVTVEVKYNPFADSKPFLATDRITILFAILPNSTTEARDYWKSKTARVAYRCVLKLAVEEEDDDDEESESEKEEPEKPEFTDKPPESEDTGSNEGK